MSLKKTIAICCMALACSSCFAQEEVGTLTLQPKAGICIPASHFSFGTEMSKIDSKRKVCFTGGVELEYQFSKHFSGSIGAQYSHENITINELSIDKQDGYDVYYRYAFNPEIDFLNVPILINYYPIKGLAIKVGIQTNIVLSHNYTTTCSWTCNSSNLGDWISFDTSGYTNFPNGQPTGLCTYYGDLYYDINKVGISIPIGLSYEYKHFVLDYRYNLGLTKIATNKLTNTSYYGSSFYITLGYKFAL